MIASASFSGAKVASATTALKILVDKNSDGASAPAPGTVVDASQLFSKTVSIRALDPIAQITESDKLADYAKPSAEVTKWSYRPERTMPANKLHEPILAKDEAAMRALGATGWIAHYAPKLSQSDFEAEARKTLEYNLQSSDADQTYKYYKNAIQGPTTQFSQSEDGKTLVSRTDLDQITRRYQTEMSARQAIMDGSIEFIRPEDEIGLNYTGVSYDMYKDGEFHGNFMNYSYDFEHAKELDKQGIGTYKWSIGLLGFYAKFKLLDLSEIGG
ncbi:protein of unknown function [Methylorubrum extorquens]|uniref:Uncharacterized protein n=1 Tax=Methylorubrum extorquens TaxID=408 RepID=A0A2N9AVR0_METEX|nr:protein of unknown function [Methylorubrum extorquens]